MALATGQLRIVRWAIWITTIVVAVSFVGGLTAAALGGPFIEIGSGAGGLYAVPSLVLDVTALAIGVPAGMIVARHLRPESRWLRAGVIVGGGLWIVAIFHLLAHATPAAVLTAGYVWAIRRWVAPLPRHDNRTTTTAASNAGHPEPNGCQRHIEAVLEVRWPSNRTIVQLARSQLLHYRTSVQGRQRCRAEVIGEWQNVARRSTDARISSTRPSRRSSRGATKARRSLISPGPRV